MYAIEYVSFGATYLSDESYPSAESARVALPGYLKYGYVTSAHVLSLVNDVCDLSAPLATETLSVAEQASL